MGLGMTQVIRDVHDSNHGDCRALSLTFVAYVDSDGPNGRNVMFQLQNLKNEEGRIGYLVLWLMGAPVSLLLILWVIFGNNLIGAG